MSANTSVEVEQTASVSETLVETIIVLSGIIPHHCEKDAFDTHSAFPYYSPTVTETDNYSG